MSRKSRNLPFPFTLVTTGLLFVAVVHGQGPNSIPNGAHFPNPGGTASTYSTAGSVDLTEPFFQTSLSSRAPYFHNGSARTLLDVVRCYEVRFGVSFTARKNRTWSRF